MILLLPGWALNAITVVLKKGRQKEIGAQRQRRKMGCDEKAGGFEDTKLLALKLEEGVLNQGMQET